MIKKILVKNYKIKFQYKSSFKNRRQIIQENSLRSKLYKIRYTAVIECVSEFVRSNETPFLDAGCGDGVFIEKIIYKFPRIIGLDLSFRSLFYIKKNEKYIQHVPLIQGDIENLPLKSAKIPLIVSIETLEHLVDMERGLTEIKRCLCPQGILIATVPSVINYRNIKIIGKNSFLRGLMKILFSILKGYVSHTWEDEQGFNYPHKVYYKRKIKKIISDCGFRIVKIKNTPLVISLSENNLAEKKINKITRNFFGELFVLVSTKK